jgi:hypothetical protein
MRPVVRLIVRYSTAPSPQRRRECRGESIHLIAPTGLLKIDRRRFERSYYPIYYIFNQYPTNILNGRSEEMRPSRSDLSILK